MDLESSEYEGWIQTQDPGVQFNSSDWVDYGITIQ